jgi:hypothetical protein
MDQRQLRLGDTVDDYCPRERRITNHAVVVIVDQQIKQTRCTTCEAEHAYKAAKVPPRRKKKDAPAQLYEQVLAGKDKDQAAESSQARPAAPVQAATPEPPIEPEPEAEPAPVIEEGPVHRPLIRATLPRPEGQPAGRPIPEFTVRNSGRSGSFRDESRGQRPWQTGNGARQPGGQGPRPGRQHRPSRGPRNGNVAYSSPFGPRSSERQPSHVRHGRPPHAARPGKKRSK